MKYSYRQTLCLRAYISLGLAAASFACAGETSTSPLFEASHLRVLPPDPCLEEPKKWEKKYPPASPAQFKTSQEAFKKGKEAFAAGNYAQALGNYQQALNHDPENGLAHLGFAEAQLYTSNDLELAHFHLAQALIKLPQNPKAHHRYATVLGELKRKELALKHWDCALALKPDYTEARFALAKTLVDGGSIPQAIQHLKKILEKESNLQAMVLLGDCYVATSQPSQAASYIKQAAQMAGRSAALYRRAGKLYAQAGLEEDAQAMRIQADAIDPPPEKRKYRPLRKRRRKKRKKR